MSSRANSSQDWTAITLSPPPRADQKVPEKPNIDGLEVRWATQWETGGTYQFDRTAPREHVFAIDTPPPTVSGSLHVGHIFSYTHTDTIARYRRMTGKAVFYPMGWDDNGLPTERRVENFYGVRCDPTVPYVADYAPPAKPSNKRGDYERISRRNFIDLCHALTQTDEKAFLELWTRLGLSVDWSLTYSTIDARSQRVSQLAFLHNLRRGEAYSQDAPTLWDVTFQTAVAQAELEDRDCPGAYYDIPFDLPDGGRLVISTTRPELLVSCVALVAHPDDDRYRSFFGRSARSPIFDVEVPICAHVAADPGKGTGIAMICTFGDTTDITWWRDLNLETRSVMGRSGRFASGTPDWISSEHGRTAYAVIAGKTVVRARELMVNVLREAGKLVADPKPITHSVKFFEKGDHPLEIITSRQWYVRNGGRDPDLRHRLLQRGQELSWSPEHMRVRYEHWVQGLNADWLISRQRYFGVPIPVWYRLDAESRPDYSAPILPDESTLPIDPQSHVPPGFTADQRNKAGGFTGDPDVMDTWATSSLTPQIATGWPNNAELFTRTFPMDMRPQAHEIIRTWLFSTLVRSHFEHDCLPWRSAVISGWILDPDRKKMSKSKGNVITPMGLLEKYGSDGVRYWAASGRPGADTVFDEKQMNVGRRLAVKILNVSKFAVTFGGDPNGQITHPLDLAMLDEMADVLDECSAALEEFDSGRALQRVESFFWWLCDDYVELVKDRAYSAAIGSASARNALAAAISTIQRLFAPFLPFVTEETWSWWMPGSVHSAPWPRVPRRTAALPAELLRIASDVLREVRRAKSERGLSMKVAVRSVVVRGEPERLEALRLAEEDLRNAGHIGSLDLLRADSFAVEVGEPDLQSDATGKSLNQRKQ